MSWTEVNIADLPTDEGLVPADTYYVFELLTGSRYGKFDPNRIEIGGRIAEGENTGRICYGSYPDPEKQPWSLGVFARTIKALGADAGEGEDPVAYLTRKAGMKFLAKVRHRTYEEQTKQELNVGSIKAYQASE